MIKRRKIGIIGYGVMGQHIETFLIEQEGNDVLDIYYFDDFLYNNGKKNAFKFNDYDSAKFIDLSFYIGLGYRHLVLRKEISEKILYNNSQLPSFVHRTSYINPTAKISHGAFIYPMCNIDHMVRIEAGVIVNNSSMVGHNSVIGGFTYIAGNIAICGNVKIGEYCFLGTGTLISNNITIGDNVKIGIGSNVTKNIQPNLSVVGNPLKILDKDLKVI